MSYLFSDLVTSVRRHVKDTAFDQSLLLEYFDEAQKEILEDGLYDFMEETYSPALGEDDYQISLDDEVLQIIGFSAVRDATDATIDLNDDYLAHREFFAFYPFPETSSTGSPTIWTQFARAIIFCQPMDQDYTFTLRYVKAPETVELATQEPLIPEAFKQIYIRAGRAGVEEYRGNWDIAALHRRKVEDYVASLKMAHSTRQLIRLSKEKTSRVRSAQL